MEVINYSIDCEMDKLVFDKVYNLFKEERAKIKIKYKQNLLFDIVGTFNFANLILSIYPLPNDLPENLIKEIEILITNLTELCHQELILRGH